MLGLRVWVSRAEAHGTVCRGRGLKPTVRVVWGAISADRRDFDLAANGDCGPQSAGWFDADE